MKELIEKMKELITDANDSHELQWNIGFKNAISIIEEQEAKEFNPLELGFKLHSVEQYPNYTNYAFFDTELNDYLDIDDFCLFSEVNSNGNLLWSLHRDGLEDSFNFISIPNHRFGVELLKNLGVIE